MNPLLIIAVPLGLVILGMILNSTGLAYDQPPSSPEQDPLKKLTAEKEAYRKFFDLQRSRSTKRQKRVGQYAWLTHGRLYRGLHLVVYGHREQDQPFESSCRDFKHWQPKKANRWFSR